MDPSSRAAYLRGNMYLDNVRQSLVKATVELYIPLPQEGFERTKDSCLKECVGILSTAIPHINRFEQRRRLSLDEAQFSLVIEQAVLQARKEVTKSSTSSFDPLNVSEVKEHATTIALRAKRLIIANQFEVRTPKTTGI